MKKKTLIFVQNVWFPQQWAIDIFYYAKYLSRYDDIHVKVIVSTINNDISHPNLEILAVWNHGYVSFIYKAYRQIQQRHKQHFIEYVYFFAQHPWSVLLQCLIKYTLYIKTIYDVVSWPIGRWILTTIAKYTIKLWVALADRYVVLDQWIQTLLSLPENKKNIIIPMWYDSELFTPNSTVSRIIKKDNEIIFTYIGSLNTERRLDIFLQAFQDAIQHTDRKIALYVIWSWSAESELKTIAWNYLDTHIFFLWSQPHETIPDYINSSDILVSYVPKVSYFEHQPPTKLIEYLACNKPVIATNTIAQVKILEWYEFMLHEDDMVSTYRKIKKIISQFQSIQQGQYNQLIQHLSWKLLCDKLYNFLMK